MEGQGNPFEEIQIRAKSTLASQVKDILVDTSELIEKDDADLSPVEDDTKFSPEKKLELVRKLVEDVIKNVPKYPPNKAIEGLAKMVLAMHVRAELNATGESAERKVIFVRSLVERFIVNP